MEIAAQRHFQAMPWTAAQRHRHGSAISPQRSCAESRSDASAFFVSQNEPPAGATPAPSPMLPRHAAARSAMASNVFQPWRPRRHRRGTKAPVDPASASVRTV